MGFRLSSDGAKLAWLVYGFGSIGVISLLFGLNPTMGGIDLGRLELGPTYATGVLGLATLFLTTVFFFRVVREYAEYRLISADKALQILSSTEDILKITGDMSADPKKEPIGLDLLGERKFFRRLLVISSGFTTILEILFPLMFGALCIVILAYPVKILCGAILFKLSWI
jgi:hypothetical protein